MLKKIGEQYSIPLLGVWSSFEEINFDLRPQKIALKANHGSGMNPIITDKSKMNMEEPPKNSQEMVDWYVLDDNSLKFGEMTFTPESGISQFQLDERDKINGELIGG